MPVVIMFYLSICPFIQPRTEIGNENKIINKCTILIKFIWILCKTEETDLARVGTVLLCCVCLPGLLKHETW